MRLPPREARNLAPGRLRTPLAHHYGWAARSSLDGPAHFAVSRKRGPELRTGNPNAAHPSVKWPHVERRKAASRSQGTRRRKASGCSRAFRRSIPRALLPGTKRKEGEPRASQTTGAMTLVCLQIGCLTIESVKCVNVCDASARDAYIFDNVKEFRSFAASAV